MHLTVTFPSLSIAGDISRYLLKLPDHEVFRSLIEDPEPRCRKLVEQEFRSAVESMHGLFDPAAFPEEVIIEIRDDLATLRPTVLGSFDLHNTKINGVCTFTISAYLVLDLLLKHSNHKAYFDVVSPRDLWVHELVHLADFTHVDRQFSRMDADTVARDSRKKIIVGYVPQDPSDLQLPREWQFLSAISQYRSEGLAQLLPVLSGEEGPVLRSREEAVALFRSLFAAFSAWLVRPRSGVFYHPFTEINKFFEAFHMNSYSIGPWLMLDALESQPGGGFRDLVLRGRAILCGTLPASTPDAISIVKHGIAMDLGAVIRGAAEYTGGGNPFFTREEIIELCHFISLDDACPNEYPNVIAITIESAMHGDSPRFIACLKSVLGMVMDKGDISTLWQQVMRKTKHTDDIVLRLKPTAGELVRSLENDPSNEVLLWTLTYILDPEDIIADAMPYLGSLDDCYVAEAGLKLYRMTHSC